MGGLFPTWHRLFSHFLKLFLDNFDKYSFIKKHIYLESNMKNTHLKIISVCNAVDRKHRPLSHLLTPIAEQESWLSRRTYVLPIREDNGN